jgi:hypothetical protein
MTHEHHDRDTVIVDRGNNGMGMVLGVIAVVALLVAVWWMTMGPGAGSGSTTDGQVQPLPSVQIELPSVAPEGS